MTQTQTPQTGLTVGAQVVGDSTTRGRGRVGTVTRVIDADGALGGLFEVRWDGERRAHPSAGWEAGNSLVSLDLLTEALAAS